MNSCNSFTVRPVSSANSANEPGGGAKIDLGPGQVAEICAWIAAFELGTVPPPLVRRMVRFESVSITVHSFVFRRQDRRGL